MNSAATLHFETMDATQSVFKAWYEEESDAEDACLPPLETEEQVVKEARRIYSLIRPLPFEFGAASQQHRKEQLMSTLDLIESERYSRFYFALKYTMLKVMYEVKDMAYRLNDTLALRIVEFKIKSERDPWSNDDIHSLMFAVGMYKNDWSKIARRVDRAPEDCRHQFQLIAMKALRE